MTVAEYLDTHITGLLRQGHIQVVKALIPEDMYRALLEEDKSLLLMRGFSSEYLVYKGVKVVPANVARAMVTSYNHSGNLWMTAFDLPTELSGPKIHVTRCECGATKVGSSLHSNWCPLN